jgi:multidrug efflux pump subunit AcrA (membrane-fusion protein)
MRPFTYFVLVIAVLSVLAGCSSSKSADAADTETAATPVQVETAKRESVQKTITVEGTLFPMRQANIVPKISAQWNSFL